jgi:hypothetical protein
MARVSLRDRFFTPQVARAIVSPTGILALGAGAGLGILSGGGAPAAIGLGAAAYAARLALALPRGHRQERIDPFAVDEPWRRYVQDARQAHARFREAVEGARPGPTQDRLRAIGDRVETGVREVWQIARRGHELVEARRRIDPAAVRHELDALQAAADSPPGAGSALEQTTASLEAQLATVERLQRVIGDADVRLRLLTARLDEAAARTIELAVHASDVVTLRGLGDDVDAMVDEMEALRQAIEETGGRSAEPGAG